MWTKPCRTQLRPASKIPPASYASTVSPPHLHIDLRCMHRRHRGCWEAEACSTPGARCGLCRAPLQWWWAVWEEVDHTEDPGGFLSMWWAEYTRMRPKVPRTRPQSLHPTRGTATHEKATFLTELADRGNLPTPTQVAQGVLQGTRTPPGLEAMSRTQSALDTFPSPWPYHPWGGPTPPPTDLACTLWRWATWPSIHYTGR